MSETIEGIQRQIKSSCGLKSVVRTMKTLAAVSIGPYEKALLSLDDYVRTVEAGIQTFFRNSDPMIFELATTLPPGGVGAVVFGSDQGMVGAFNDHLARFVAEELKRVQEQIFLWPVGERVFDRLSEFNLPQVQPYRVPESVDTIPGMMSQVLQDIESSRESGKVSRILLFYNRPSFGAGFEPVMELLWPLDRAWLLSLREKAWPTRMFPELCGGSRQILSALIREYLFVSLYKASARSGASEQATRLAAMQRAEKNIDEMLEELNRAFHQKRQAAIMNELLDVVSGFEVLSNP